MSDETNFVFSFTLEELKLLFTMIAVPLKIPKSKKKLGKENYKILSDLSTRFKTQLDMLDMIGES